MIAPTVPAAFRPVTVSRRGTPPDALLAARINLIGVKESRQQGDGHDQHASFWDNIANTGSYKESLLMPEFHLSGRNEDGTQSKADLAAPGGYTVGAIALAPTQYEIRKAQEEAEARARAEAEQAKAEGGEIASVSSSLTTPASEVQATVATVREKAKTIVPDPVWTCTGVIEKHCAWVTPPDLTLRTRAESLAKTPGLEWLADIAKRDDVDWQKVELAAQNWDYKHAGLTKEGAAVVVIVVTILTWGAASSAGTAVAQGAGMTTGTVGASGATLTATGSAVAAGVAAGITTIASQAAVSLINNHGDIGQTLNDLGSSENVKQVVAAMLTAGLAKGVTQAMNLPVTGANATFMTRFANYSAQAAVSAGVKSLVFGTPLKESAKEALVTSLAQSLTAEIGDWAKDNQIPAGSLEKMLAHAVVQCAAASVMRQDCGSAALGAAIAEALSPVSDKLDQTDYSKRNELNGKLGNAIASMSAMLVADLTGKNTMTASAAAGMVDSYNRRLHPDQVKRIGDMAKGDKAKAEELKAVLCYLQSCNVDGLGKTTATDQALYDQGKALAQNDSQRYLTLVGEVKGAGLLSGQFAYQGTWDSFKDSAGLGIEAVGKATKDYLTRNMNSGTAVIPDSPVDNGSDIQSNTNWKDVGEGAAKALASMVKDGPTYEPENADQATGANAVNAAVTVAGLGAAGLGGKGALAGEGLAAEEAGIKPPKGTSSYDDNPRIATDGEMVTNPGTGSPLVVGERIPSNANFDTSNLESKLSGYLLDSTHPQNQTKANWFSQALGFDQSNWSDLAKQLYFDPETAVLTKTSLYGKTYEQVIAITGANGKTIDTTFVFLKDNSGVVRLVTGIPAKR